MERFNLYSYLILTKAVSYFDLKRTYGSLEAALGQSKAKFLALSISSIGCIPPSKARPWHFSYENESM